MLHGRVALSIRAYHHPLCQAQCKAEIYLVFIENVGFELNTVLHFFAVFQQLRLADPDPPRTGSITLSGAPKGGRDDQQIVAVLKRKGRCSGAADLAVVDEDKSFTPYYV